MHGARKERSPSETDVDMGGSTLTNHDPMSPIDGLDPIPMSTSVGGMAWAWHVSLSRLGFLLPITTSTSLIVLLSRLLRFFLCKHPSKWFHRRNLTAAEKARRLWGAPKSGPFPPVGPGSWAFLWIMIWTCHALLGGNNAAFPCYLGCGARAASHQSFFSSLSLGFLILQRRNMIITCF